MINRLFSLTLMLCSVAALAQEVEIERDTVPENRQDSVLIKRRGKIITIESYAARFDPRKALLYSAVFPGMGQVYNKKYWKVPLVYGGFVGGVYLISIYQGIHDQYKTELFDLITSGAPTTSAGRTEAQLRNIVRKARRERDFITIATVFWYMLQMVDAHVDAHLKEFDLNPQLQMSLEPDIKNDMMTGKTTGLTLRLKF
jgi:hypothetical protein